jgi:hypothetical protein
MSTRARRRGASQIGDLFEAGCASQYSPHGIFGQLRMGKSAMFSSIRDPLVTRQVFQTVARPCRRNLAAEAEGVEEVAGGTCEASDSRFGVTAMLLE